MIIFESRVSFERKSATGGPGGCNSDDSIIAAFKVWEGVFFYYRCQRFDLRYGMLLSRNTDDGWRAHEDKALSLPLYLWVSERYLYEQRWRLSDPMFRAAFSCFKRGFDGLGGSCCDIKSNK